MSDDSIIDFNQPMSQEQALALIKKSLSALWAEHYSLKQSLGQSTTVNQPSLSYMKELNAIKGIGPQTVNDIVLVYPTKEELVQTIKAGKKLPFRNDVVNKLKLAYD